MRTRPKVRREIARAVWEYRQRTIRANRIRRSKVHRAMTTTQAHTTDPYHCVCNGTHVVWGWCPRCPQR